MTKLKYIGKYIEIPIAGLEIKKLTYDGHICLTFSTSLENSLTLYGSFTALKYNQSKAFDVKDKEALMFFRDQFGYLVEEARADKEGQLWIVFSNKVEVYIEDGPYTNWHYFKKNERSENISIYGGVGTTG